jgi:hypothetical protein
MGQTLPLNPRHVSDIVVNAFDRDAPIGIVKTCQEFAQCLDRIQNRPAERAGMKVSLRSEHGDLGGELPAQSDRQRRLVGPPHLGIGDHGAVGLERLSVPGQKRTQARTSDLLLAFE